jgi:23S rRNA pseudouridine1911/1915/1917 synthase
MSDLFSRGLMTKTYLAIVSGVPAQTSGTVGGFLERKRVAGQARVVVVDRASGAMPTTEYRVLGTHGRHAALLRLHPHTGRQHQLRVHCKSMLRCPILGDELYAPDTSVYVRQLLSHLAPLPMFLHAAMLEIPHYHNGRSLIIKAPVPSHFKEAAHELGFRPQLADEAALVPSQSSSRTTFSSLLRQPSDPGA